jgi:hypothetical protein
LLRPCERLRRTVATIGGERIIATKDKARSKSTIKETL